MLIANDISSSRAKGLLKNIEVFGIGNVLVLSEEPGRLENYFTEYFDKILIDAPCSGEGMFRKDKKMVKAWEEHGPEFFSNLQRNIILQAARMLKPGGLMLYSTCTFDPSENERIIEHLKKEYPDAGCTLDYNQAWKLLVSVRLAAQCTDARVNVVVKGLFEKYPNVAALADAPVEDIEAIVKPCGLGHSKARDISACMKMLRDEYGGHVPDDFNALLKLPGVGRKSANLIMGDVFGKPAIVTDTHCIRLVNRIGLVEGIKDPKRVEMALWKLVPPEEGSDFCHRLVYHGREVCTARTKPYCDKCLSLIHI